MLSYKGVIHNSSDMVSQLYVYTRAQSFCSTYLKCHSLGKARNAHLQGMQSSLFLVLIYVSR